ncbi:hypothetical protein TcBrA4_0020810 [Trypanosoma cruzi]|nr:hypothetical protein TcBrA4_0020810 [Trypanosoma cruzi]
MLGAFVATCARGACKKTLAPLWHPHPRPSQNIRNASRARRTCALILWTDERTLLQIGQENLNPPLAGRQGFAVLTSGRVLAEASGPFSSVRKGRHHRHRRLLLIRRARAGMSRVGRDRTVPVRRAATRGTMSESCQEYQSLPHRQAPAMRCTRLSFLLGISPVQSPDCSEKVHVPDWAVLLREGSCNHGFVVSGLIAWDTAVRWREHEVYRVTSLYQEEQQNPTLFSDVVSHGQWNDAESLNCRQGVRSHQDSCGRLGCSQTKGMRCLMPLSVARHSALYEDASLPAAARCTSTGGSFVVVEPYNSAAYPDASSAREEETSVHNSKSYAPREE